MPYETGAKVRLTRDVQVTADGTAARNGFPGPLYLAEGLGGVVTGLTNEAGGGAQDHLADFDQRFRDSRFDDHAARFIGEIRQQLVRQGGFDSGVGARIRYKVRFENGFVLSGVEEDWLTGA
ncbi:hypothetical protein [Streptomyces sp. NPDC058718]|uniref:hypothetical protein n=1 Tax=Streptomyces sp. NPDC058718 TaxID=3346610 RepID=UPI0036A9E44C